MSVLSNVFQIREKFKKTCRKQTCLRFFQKKLKFNFNFNFRTVRKKIRGKTSFRKNIWKPQKSETFQFITCHQKFPTAAKLQSHVIMEHTKVACDVCENAFSQIDLKKHRASIHWILPNDAFKCQFCPMFFKFEKNLKRHTGSKHA